MVASAAVSQGAGEGVSVVETLVLAGVARTFEAENSSPLGEMKVPGGEGLRM